MEPLNGALRGGTPKPSSLWTGGEARAASRARGWRGARHGRDSRGGGEAREVRGPSHSHLSPSLSQDKLTSGLLLMLMHVKFKASPGCSADALARILMLVGGTGRGGWRSETQRLGAAWSASIPPAPQAPSSLRYPTPPLPAPPESRVRWVPAPAGSVLHPVLPPAESAPGPQPCAPSHCTASCVDALSWPALHVNLAWLSDGPVTSTSSREKVLPDLSTLPSCMRRGSCGSRSSVTVRESYGARVTGGHRQPCRFHQSPTPTPCPVGWCRQPRQSLLVIGRNTPISATPRRAKHWGVELSDPRPGVSPASPDPCARQFWGCESVFCTTPNPCSASAATCRSSPQNLFLLCLPNTTCRKLS